MALVTQGNIRNYYADGVAIQPGRKLTYKDDGTIEGTVTFDCDVSAVANLPDIGWQHPDDSRCELYARDITYGNNSMVRMVGSYFGIVSSKTNAVVTSSTNADRLPIELHPNFSTLAGTSASPQNGAKFDEDTGEFLGFYTADNDLFGTSSFFSPSVQVSLTYWTRSAPSMSRLMEIRGAVSGFRSPAGVKDFLLIGMPTRQVGSHYQVTEQYLGSGPDGWNTDIYT